MNNYVDNLLFGSLTWEELYYLLFFTGEAEQGKFIGPNHFTGEDIIRFYENNLLTFDQEIVLDYFCTLCKELEDEEFPMPEEIPPTEPFYPLPIPIYPLPPPPSPPSLPVSYPSLPGTPPLLPPPNTEVSPGFIFILIQALPPDLLDILKNLMGVTDVEAAVIEREHIISAMTEEMQQIVSMYQNETQVLQSEIDRWIETSRYQANIIEKLKEYIAQLVFKGDLVVSEPEKTPWDDPFWESNGPKPPETQFPEWWEDFESEDYDVGTDYVTADGYTHGEVIRACEFLDREVREYTYKGWFISNEINFYIFELEGEEYVWDGDYIIYLARYHGWSKRTS